MKIGDKITAFDVRKGIDLTPGKQYNIRGLDGNKIKVIGDKGIVRYYSVKNFLSC